MDFAFFYSKWELYGNIMGHDRLGFKKKIF